MKDKGKWLPKEGRYKNLAYGQWQFSTWQCRLFDHAFVDPRIFKQGPKIWEKCHRCGLERKWNQKKK